MSSSRAIERVKRKAHGRDSAPRQLSSLLTGAASFAVPEVRSFFLTWASWVRVATLRTGNQSRGRKEF